LTLDKQSNITNNLIMAETTSNSGDKPGNSASLDESVGGAQEVKLPPGIDNLKPTNQRFSSSSGADSLVKATEESLRTIVDTPPDASSQWRSGSLPPEGKSGTTIEGLREGDQIVAPLEGNASFEYKSINKLPDGSLKEGKVVIASRNGVTVTIEGENMQLLVGGASVPTEISEDGVVKSSQEIPVKKDDLLFTIKKQPSGLNINIPSGAPTSGNSSPTV
jgi:hypothetical protein